MYMDVMSVYELLCIFNGEGEYQGGTEDLHKNCCFLFYYYFYIVIYYFHYLRYFQLMNRRLSLFFVLSHIMLALCLYFT